jgi:hypothetical protein
MTKSLLSVSVITIAVLGWQPLARAQSAHEAEIIGFHQMCQKGDRRACVHFGMMIEHDHDMQAEWRRTHPEFFWWEK